MIFDQNLHFITSIWDKLFIDKTTFNSNTIYHTQISHISIDYLIIINHFNSLLKIFNKRQNRSKKSRLYQHLSYLKWFWDSSSSISSLSQLTNEAIETNKNEINEIIKRIIKTIERIIENDNLTKNIKSKHITKIKRMRNISRIFMTITTIMRIIIWKQ